MAGIKTTAVGAASGQRACKYQNAGSTSRCFFHCTIAPLPKRRISPLPACYGKTSSLFFDYAVSTEFR
jgi:hypothetical protein